MFGRSSNAGYGVIDYFVNEDDLVLAEGARPVGVSSAIVILVGVWRVASAGSVIGVFLRHLRVCGRFLGL